MRIATNHQYTQGVDGILNQQAQLAKVQDQISSGKKLENPSDDPVAAVQILGINKNMALLNQYKDNAADATGKLKLAEGTLTSSNDILQRIRDLAVQGLNDTNSDGSRDAIASEMDQLNKSLVGLANTTDSNGNSLFSGYQSKAKAFNTNTYAYQGDNGRQNIRVGSGYLVETTYPGDQVFIGKTEGGPRQSVFQTVNNFITALKTGTVNTAPNDSTILSNLDNVMDQVNLAVTDSGSKQNAIEQQSSVNDSSISNLTAQLSNLQDLDYSAAVTSLTQQSTALQVAQKSFASIQHLSLFNYL